MSCLFEEELLSHYYTLRNKLMSAGFSCELFQIHDYLLKATISDVNGAGGKLLIDFSSKKNKFGYRRDNDMSVSFFGELSKHLGSDNIINRNHSKKTNQNEAFAVKPEALDIPCHAWVDGSYLCDRVGYGVAILMNGELVDELYGEVTDPIAVKSRQVGGELRAVMEAIRWCKRHEQREMVVFFDFLNIEKWAIGAYKTNNEMTKAYKAYVESSPVRIVWNKVDSHTGVAWNEHADQLAKRGAMGETSKGK